jgi:signal transduction histidine kinase
MVPWSTLDTVLAAVAAVSVAFGLWAFFVKGRRSGSASSRAADISAEHGRAELTLKAAELGDRLRIVYEQQAVVSHELVGLVAKAESTAFVTAGDKAALKRHTELLVKSARQALTDMRRAMTIAHQGADMVEVWPTLSTIATLFAEIEERGLVIDFTERGKRFEISASAELTVYRILTESLENTLKHAGPGTEVELTIEWSEHGMTITVSDDGERSIARRAAAAGEPMPEGVTIESDQAALVSTTMGRGLTEMRARAEAFDGIVMTQRVPGIGFTLTASFPMIRYATDPKTAE